MVTEGKIDAEEKGLYRLPDIYLDEWFVLSIDFQRESFLWRQHFGYMVYL